jgi:hypothetical protein
MVDMYDTDGCIYLLDFDIGYNNVLDFVKGIHYNTFGESVKVGFNGDLVGVWR